MKRLFRGALSVGLLLGLVGCRTLSEPTNLSRLKEEIVQYVDSGRYLKQIDKVSREAIDWVERRANGGDGPRAERGPARLAVVFDIDETLLSNLPHMRRMDFGYVPAEWEAWVARGEAPCLEPVREIYRCARRLGIAVILITGRYERDRAGTENNLRRIDVTDYAQIFFAPEGAKETAENFKTATRARLVREGYTIIASIGDQESDLAGGFAERTFKLPAPFYLSK